MIPENEALPPVGVMLRDRSTGFTARVADVFPSGQYAGMILEWTGYRMDLDGLGPRGQAFTTKDWRKRWEVQMQ